MAVVGGLQKVRYARENLPPVSIFPDGSIGHYVRYRVVSEDRNRYSHWSPVYLVKIPAFTLLGVVAVTYTSSTVTAVWGDELNRPRYDVFIRWGNAIDRVSSVGTTRTVRTGTTAHGFQVGDVVKIVNTTANYDGVHTVTSVGYTSSPTVLNTFSFTATVPQTENNATVAGNASFNGYYYHGTPSVHNYSFMRTGTSTIEGKVRDLSKFNIVHVDIQVESIDKVYSTDLLIYDSPDLVGYPLT